MADDNFSEESLGLSVLSPLDGRYAADTRPLREYWSEFAFLRERLRFEVEYLIAITLDAHLARPLTDAEVQILRAIVADLTLEEASKIKGIEMTTRHDVKALEYYLHEKLSQTTLADIIGWVHFGLTSEDANQTAFALALRNSRDAVMLPALGALLMRLERMTLDYRKTAMLARTHGQVAVPTTLGKEFAVFVSRLRKQRELLRTFRFESKVMGAVGNLNALALAAPQVNWLKFVNKFVRSLGLEPNLITTQLVPYDNWIRYFDTLRLTNTILLDLTQDVWRYVSDEYLTLRVIAGQVGSSTMPQKVNPIDLENAEGNLGVANALFAHYANKLPVSRLQRDLSDSTVRRTFGVALGHTLLAWKSLTRGLAQVQANEPKMREDLEAHWEVLAEAAQTILRSEGAAQAYEELKTLTRGKTLSREQYLTWVEGLEINAAVKARLSKLTPLSYLGLAEEIVDLALFRE